MQHIITILNLSAIYFIVAQSFVLMYITVKFFNLAHGAIITIGAYLVFLFFKQLDFSFFSAIIISLIISGAFGVLIYHLLYKPLIKKKVPSLIYLIVSLGIYVILSNSISILWSNGTKSIRPKATGRIYQISDAFIADYQLYTIILGILIFAVLFIIIKFSKIGKQIIAVSENETLSSSFGIKVEYIQYFVFALGSILGAMIGILYGFDTDLTPNMGFKVLLYGIITMIIGGVGSNKGLILGAILLAATQYLGGFYFESKWLDAVAYIILVLFLIWRPLGFSGKRLKKINI